MKPEDNLELRNAGKPNGAAPSPFPDFLSSKLILIATAAGGPTVKRLPPSWKGVFAWLNGAFPIGLCRVSFWRFFLCIRQRNDARSGFE